MFTPFRLKKTIGEAYSMDLEDSLNTKKALARLGHLEEPEDGFDEYPDRPMIEAVRSFQRANSLVEDGVMKPDGPTLKRLNESLVARQERVPPPPGVIVINPDTDRERAPLRRPVPPFNILRPVRASSNVDLSDVTRVKSALERLGLPLPEGASDPFPTQDLFKNIRAFQQREGLRVDGEMLPGGETEARMNELMKEQARAAQNTASTRPQSATSAKPKGPIEHHLPGHAVPPGEGVSMDEQGNRYDADGRPIDVRNPLHHRAALPAVPVALPVVLGSLVAAGVLTQAQSAQIQQAFKAGGGKAAEALEMITGKLDGTAPSTPLGQLALLHKMLGHGLSGMAGRTEITPPLPPLPGYEPAPEEFRKPQKTEFPAEPPKVPDLEGFPVGEDAKARLFIFQELHDDLKKSLTKPLESRRGDRVTERGNELIAGPCLDALKAEYEEELQKRVKHVGGGTRASDGQILKEGYLPEKETKARKGSSYADITLENELTGDKLHANTANMLKDGKTPVADERRKLYKMRNNADIHDVVTALPKLRPGMDEKEYVNRCIELLREPYYQWMGRPNGK